MATFKNQAILSKPVEEVYHFLADLNNHEKLMPPNVQDWQSTSDQASFSIPAMAGLALKIANKVENQYIQIIPAQKAPFDISLAWQTEAVSHTETRVLLTIEADLNMMMKMLASGPLQKLVDEQVGNLKKVLAG